MFIIQNHSISDDRLVQIGVYSWFALVSVSYDVFLCFSDLDWFLDVFISSLSFRKRSLTLFCFGRRLEILKLSLWPSKSRNTEGLEIKWDEMHSTDVLDLQSLCSQTLMKDRRSQGFSNEGSQIKAWGLNDWKWKTLVTCSVKYFFFIILHLLFFLL